MTLAIKVSLQSYFLFKVIGKVKVELMNPKVTINVFLQSYFHIEIAGKVEVEHINQ